MTSIPWGDVAIILALILLNGFFAGAELAIVSARRPRLLVLERAGVSGVKTALALQAAQGRFLSAVQIGITLVGIANGAVSGARLSGPTAVLLTGLGVPEAYATEIGFALVIVAVTYLSLIIGELVPKQWALRAPERTAALVAPFMQVLTRVASPFVTLLDASSRMVFRLLRIQPNTEKAVTEEELRHIFAEAESAGVIEERERELIGGIMRLADRQVRGVMTPRPEVEWISLETPTETVREKLFASPHSRLVVAEGTIDRVVGVLQVRDALTTLLHGGELDLRTLVRKAPVVPDVADATVVMAALRDSDVPMAIVIDEYGHFEGVVTPADLLMAIAGEFRSDMDEGDEPTLLQREDGSWLVAGSLPADEFAEHLDFTLDEERDYQTMAGFALAWLEHIPETGEIFTAHGYRFEIIDMDGRKIDKLLVTPTGEE